MTTSMYDPGEHSAPCCGSCDNAISSASGALYCVGGDAKAAVRFGDGSRCPYYKPLGD